MFALRTLRPTEKQKSTHLDLDECFLSLCKAARGPTREGGRWAWSERALLRTCVRSKAIVAHSAPFVKGVAHKKPANRFAPPHAPFVSLSVCPFLPSNYKPLRGTKLEVLRNFATALSALSPPLGLANSLKTQILYNLG